MRKKQRKQTAQPCAVEKGGDMDHALDLTPGQWREWFAGIGEPDYRAAQVLDWLYAKWEADPGRMSNISRSLRELMRQSFDWKVPVRLRKITSEDGKTTKFTFRLQDGDIIESVLMDQGARYSFCISTQAGCGLGCRFCATARTGFRRNLTVPEVMAQILFLSGECRSSGNVVFMGMGEPLLNMDVLSKVLYSLTDGERLGIGSRRITVSTAGITAGIERLSEHPARPNLALSLNSPFSGLRSRIMPVNRREPLDGVLDSCRRYCSRTGRRLMLEYVLLGGVNTSEQAAKEVAEMARSLQASVNLIAFNEFEGAEYAAPSRKEIADFRTVLDGQGVVVTQRYKRGAEIAAGCGQLSGAE